MGSIVFTPKEFLFFAILSLFSLFLQSTSLSIIVVLLLIAYVYKRKEISFIWSILAPRITGSAPILTSLIHAAREEGPGNHCLNDVLILNIPFLPKLVFILKDTYIKRVLSTEPDHFPTGGAEGPMVKISAQSGDNILLSAGPPHENWARYRETAAPFNKDRFGSTSLLSLMFNCTWNNSQSLSLSHLSPLCDGRELNLFKELFEIMIPTHNRALFGEEFARKFQYQNMSSDVYDIISETGKQLKFNFCPPWIKGPYMAQIKRVQDAVYYMMKDSTSPFMKLFLDAQKAKKLNEEQLLSNMMIYEFAQAPLHVVFWILYLLSLHPEEERKVISEIEDVLKKGEMSYERVGEFKYFGKVVMETLRLFPGVGLLQVRSSKYNTMFGDHFVPEGSLVFLCAYMIHRNATYWPNPDEFDPSREGIDAAKYGENLTFIPFGNGPRQCLGQYFALDFVKVTTISILQHFKITLAPGQKEIVPTEIGFLRPENPIFVRIEKRNLQISTPSVKNQPGQSASPSSVSPSPSSSSLASSQSLAPPSPSLSSSSSSLSHSLSPRIQQLQASESHLKKLPSRFKLSKASKMTSLTSQSQIFKETFVSIGKLVNTKDLLVLYGSQTGKARGFAIRVVQMAKLCKISPTLLPLSELDVSIVKSFKFVVVVTSTYGDGTAPENAEKFAYWLENETSTTIFSGVPYAVLSLGSSMYPSPFKFGTLLSQKFSQMGAKRIIPDQRLDEIKYNTQEEFTSWSERLFEGLSSRNQRNTSFTKRGDTINESISISGVGDLSLVARNRLLGFTNFDFTLLIAPFKLTFTSQTLSAEPKSFVGEREAECVVVSNTLANNEPENRIYILELKYNSPLEFQAGDNVILYPSQPKELVDRYLARLGFEGSKVFTVDNDEINDITFSSSLGRNKTTLENALTHSIDLTSPPSTSLLQFFAMKSTNPHDQKILLSYVDNYPSFLAFQYSPIDLLESIPSIVLNNGSDMKKSEESLAVFLGLLGPVKSRHYSVANFPLLSPNTLKILYKVVTYKTKQGVEKHGICTHYLKDKKPGDEIILSIAKSQFRLPESNNESVILISAGSGVAPYLGFLEKRQHQKTNGEELGKAVLIHGCRNEPDFACKERVNEWISNGILNHLYPAYSRSPSTPKVHVNTILEEKGEEIWQIMSTGGVLFVCGDVTVGIKVRDSLVQICKVHGKMSIFLANSFVRQLTEKKKIRMDEWGFATTSGEKAIRAARLKRWRRSILAIFAFHQKSV